MRVEGLEPVALAALRARSPAAVLDGVVAGLASDGVGFALARIWLTGLGDACTTCALRTECPDQTICLHLAASAGSDDAGDALRDDPFWRVPLGVRAVGRIAAQGEALWSGDVARDGAEIAGPAWLRDAAIRSYAGHPLLFRDEVMGVLAVASRDVLDARDVESLRGFAAQVAVAVVNARAFEALATQRDRLVLERDYLREELRAELATVPMLGESDALRTLREQIELAGPSDASVLIRGEPGTGKEGFAQAIHENSGRTDAPFVRVDCSTAQRSDFAEECFGSARGGGRVARGRVELADGGTLFLDEVGELPLALQRRMLRLLHDGSFEREGDPAQPQHADARIIAATSRDLLQAIAAGTFLDELYYRLAVILIEVPPLRQHRDDIGSLANSILASAAQRLGKSTLQLSPADVGALERCDWPGNVRELQGVIERAALLAGDAPLDLEAALAQGGPVAADSLAANGNGVITEGERKQRERANIETALARTQGRIYGPGGAARILGMKPTTLASRIKALGIARR